MHRFCLLICSLFLISFSSFAQDPSDNNDDQKASNDSIRKIELAKSLGNGYLASKYFNLDLRYLIKYNQYEGIRTGLGGITNDQFSEHFRIEGYVVYGFRDHRFKYSVGGSLRLSENSLTWLHATYTDDLQETGSSTFSTDSRFFQFFEPRLINIDLFHKHITKDLTLEHRMSSKLLTEWQMALSKIDPTYNYAFFVDDQFYSRFDLSLAKISMQWNPFDIISKDENTAGYPQFTFQYTKSFDGLLKGDFNFSKFDFRSIYNIERDDKSSIEFVLTAGIASGKTPLTHLYHAYPNNVNKETILNRFSVAGINSFETMFFNEFFSDRFATLQIKNKFKPFEISKRFKPELVLISRIALGNMGHIERHRGITFNTLDKGYAESGLEINKLIFGFGLSFAYRYGAYHLPKFEDNIAFKFTFNINL